MGYEARIETDSITGFDARLTTFVSTFPRSILAEVNTHRMLSRNSASSRAIPTEKLIQRVLDDPYIPEVFTKNQKGMQASEVLTEEQDAYARSEWIAARDNAVRAVQNMMNLGVHKQDVNRVLEPWMWHTAVLTATEWANFFTLRVHSMAHPAFQKIAHMMAKLYFTSKPKYVGLGEWHLPFIQEEEKNSLGKDYAARISAARCARVSYLTHDGKRDYDADFTLYKRLVENDPPHSSPLEHPAKAIPTLDFYGNFKGWEQLRKTLPKEQTQEYTIEQLNVYETEMGLEVTTL